MSEATAESYQRLFEQNADGRAVLEDLMRRFSAQPCFIAGADGDRVTCYRLGQRAVIEHVVNQINMANGVG